MEHSSLEVRAGLRRVAVVCACRWEKGGGDGGLLPLSEGPARLGAWRLTGWARGGGGPLGRFPDFCLDIQGDGVPLLEMERPEGGAALRHGDESFGMRLRDVWAIQRAGYKWDVNRLLPSSLRVLIEVKVPACHWKAP